MTNSSPPTQPSRLVDSYMVRPPDPQEMLRSRAIRGLYALAALLQDNPALPVPYTIVAQAGPLSGPWQEQRSVVVAAAELLGVDLRVDGPGKCSASAVLAEAGPRTEYVVHALGAPADDDEAQQTPAEDVGPSAADEGTASGVVGGQAQPSPQDARSADRTPELGRGPGIRPDYVPAVAPAAPVQPAPTQDPALDVHQQVAGWAGGPGGCGMECSCGTVFDGFPSLAEANDALQRHIAGEAARQAAQRLQRQYGHLPVVRDAVAVVEAFGPVDVTTAQRLLGLRQAGPYLSDEEYHAVVAHFVSNPPAAISALADTGIEAARHLPEHLADQVLAIAAQIVHMYPADDRPDPVYRGDAEQSADVEAAVAEGRHVAAEYAGEAWPRPADLQRERFAAPTTGQGV